MKWSRIYDGTSSLQPSAHLILFSYPIAGCRKCFSVETLFLCPVFNHPLFLANCSSASDVFFPLSSDGTYLDHIQLEETHFCFGQIIPQMQIQWNTTPLL